MARDEIDMQPVETRDDLVGWLEAGIKPKSQFRIGTEHEKFGFTITHHDPVPYEGACSIRALLDGMRLLLGWEPIVEDAHIIGLVDVTGGGAISLEPGGQFELSGAPVKSVHETCAELMAHLAQLREVGGSLCRKGLLVFVSFDFLVPILRVFGILGVEFLADQRTGGGQAASDAL